MSCTYYLILTVAINDAYPFKKVLFVLFFISSLKMCWSVVDSRAWSQIETLVQLQPSHVHAHALCMQIRMLCQLRITFYLATGWKRLHTSCDRAEEIGRLHHMSYEYRLCLFYTKTSQHFINLFLQQGQNGSKPTFKM